MTPLFVLIALTIPHMVLAPWIFDFFRIMRSSKGV